MMNGEESFPGASAKEKIAGGGGGGVVEKPVQQHLF